MTKEEAIKFGNLIITMARFDSDNYSPHTEEFTKLAIKAIENQKSLEEELEKIKEEINRVVSDFHIENGDIAYGLAIAEYILDKHIFELKGENNG